MFYNQELARQLKLLSAYYRYKGGANRFRAIAYAKAAYTVSSLDYDILNVKADAMIDAIPGIGKSILQKIKSFQQTRRIEMLDEIQREVPLEWLELSMLRGLGSQILKRIRDTLKIGTRKQLIEALRTHQIETVKGIGAKKVRAMLESLQLQETGQERMLLNEADQLADEVICWMRAVPGDWLASMAGSLRRREETIGDLDLLIACEQKERNTLIKRFVSADFAAKILVKGHTRCSIVHAASHRQVDLRLVDKSQWASALHYFTGSKQHNIHLRTMARDAGFKVSEYGIKAIKSGSYIALDSESALYSRLKMSYIPPELRQDTGELEAALRHAIPKLIEAKAIRGDFQMHTSWSDGKNDLSEMADYARTVLRYDYIVITDHSKASRIAGGLHEKEILKQLDEIKRYNATHGNDFVKSGIEVDILPNGTLDISDEVLSQLDWVTASLHSGFKKDNTDRLIKACEHPMVSCIGHPTGRLIGSRLPYAIDIDEVIAAAKQTDTALEINAQPSRLDLKAEYARKASEQGVFIAIGTDAHALIELFYMKYGADVARRAWLTDHHVLNTLSWPELMKLSKKRKRLTSISRLVEH